MTIIIGSLFLPYTVQFKVDATNGTDAESINEGVTSEFIKSGSPIPSILPALSQTPQTPLSPVLRGREVARSLKNETPRTDTPEGFFYARRTKRSGTTESSGEVSTSGTPIGTPVVNVTSGVGDATGAAAGSGTTTAGTGSTSQYIQPRSRYSNVKIDSSIVETKKQHEDSGFPGITTRSQSSNLTRNNSNTNLISLAPTDNFARARSVLSGKGAGSIMMQSNHSASSLFSDEILFTSPQIPQQQLQQQQSYQSYVPSYHREDDEPWKQGFKGMIHGTNHSKLAPFGGFSNPGVKRSILNEENVFETAPWKIVGTEGGNGSLINAVNLSVQTGVMKRNKWVGILSMPSDDVPDNVKQNISKELSTDYDCEVVFPDDLTFEGHYKSFCKQILWPTLHYQIPDDPKSKAFEEHSWGHYVLMNRLVADKLVETYEKVNGNVDDPYNPENMIWVHDYHLLLVPKMIREQLPNVKIGLFLHVSFPSSEVFRCFAQRKQLLEGMLGANCISFQTNEYVRHFLQTCNRLLLADINEFGVTFEGNLTVTNTIPVGIDAADLMKQVTGDSVNEWRQMIRERWKDHKLIVSRDQLDKLRGVKHKLLAYEQFLKNNPQYIDSTVLIQICIGKSHDSDYATEIMKIVSRINALPDNISDTQPVVLLQRDIDFDQYLALECEADVFVVSSMREGLNLTCHEFIISTTERKSPLVLSEFTGSSTLLDCDGKGALLINPWDTKKFSEIFKQSLEMSEAEKKLRWGNCFEFVLTRDSKHWVANCLNSILEACNLDRRKSRNLFPFTQQVFENFIRLTGKNGKKLILLGLEISSTSINSSRDIHASSSVGKVNIAEPTRLVRLLGDLFENPNTFVYLISFLSKHDLDIMFKRYPQMGLIAENGSYIKLIGSKEWISIVDEEENENEDSSWMPQITQLIESKVERLPGSFCQVQDSTIRFHAGKSFSDDRQRSLDAMGDIIQHINSLSEELGGIHATLVRNSVIVQKNQINLMALRFLVAYYNTSLSTKSESFIQDNIEQFQTPLSPKSEVIDFFNRDEHFISAILYSGGLTTIDEANYEYINHLKDIRAVKNTLTVTVMATDGDDFKTGANYEVSGINELLRIFVRANLT
ncbi:Trehalose synthase complex regulatory subunit TPS3 [Spathaspora sp. JA1]|nr:Trehalose synthase complex regulatory subunit TPS3 [Spathaspora sp. JA1]